MTKKEYVKAMTYLGVMFNKPISKEMMEVWYEMVIDIPESTFKNAIKKLALKTKFLPSIQEIVDMCSEVQYQQTNLILEKMYSEGYFSKGSYGDLDPDHALRNYEKATMWVNEGKIPGWLLEDMKEYGYVQPIKTESHLLLENNND